MPTNPTNVDDVPTKIAHHIIQQSGHAIPRVPSYQDLVTLARAYVALVTPKTRLAEHGIPYVTVAAKRSFAEYERIGEEEAGRELTELLADATLRQSGKWAVRRRSTGLDISALVKREGRLMVITHVHTRELNK